MLRWAFVLVGLAACDRFLQLTPVASIDAPPQPPATCMRDVSTGRFHTCAVGPAGEVFCWGGNNYDETQSLGPKFVLLPQRLAFAKPAVQVGAGNGLSCARFEDGSVQCWGRNNEGELGTNTSSSNPTPIDLGGDTALDLEVGGRQACVIRASDRSVMCWGSNKWCGIAQPSGVMAVATPVVIPDTTGTQQLSLGHRHACILDASGQAACWGANFEGQVGVAPSSSVDHPTPVTTLGVVQSINASGRDTCAIVQGGQVVCWGRAYNGELATGSLTLDQTDVPTATLETKATAMAIAQNGACALLVDGTVACWGDIDEGKGTAETTATPVMSTLTGVTRLSAHWRHQCALANGAVQCWGNDIDGQLGRNARAITPMPTVVTLPGSPTGVAATSGGACAIVGGQVYCWGENDFGQVGDGTLVDHYMPSLVPGITNAIGVAANAQQACAWGTGFTTCWGRNTEGQLGDGQSTRQNLLPAAFGVSGVKAMALGAGFSCAIDGGAKVECVGRNKEGQLGNGTFTQQENTPQATAGLGGVMRLAAGAEFACAIDNVNSLWCWGYNGDGEVGDGTTTNRDAPVHILTSNAFSEVAAGGYHACAIASVGSTVYCWGSNSNGQLGQGDTDPRSAPVTVVVQGTPQSIYAGLYTTCVKNTGGDVYCWGKGDNGELGDGATTGSSTPRLVSSLKSMTAMSRSEGGGCALASGAVECWGANTMLGNGDYSRSMPATVTGLPCH